MLLFGAKKRQFFDYFEAAAQNAYQASLEIREFLSVFDKHSERAKRLKELEHAGDRITHDAMQHLAKTFITPLNREDIRELASRLDDIVDMIDESAARIVLYRPNRPQEEAKGVADILTRLTATLVETVPLIRNMRNSEKILAKCREISALEKEADRASEQALAKLLGSPPEDPREVIKWKDIYEDLETACNHCKHVANALEEIVIKNN